MAEAALPHTRFEPVAGAVLGAVRHPAFVPACIGLGLVLRLAAALLLPFAPESDAGWYVGRVHTMLAGGGYSEGGHPTAYWPVGWPALLAAVTAVVGSVRVAVVVLNIGAAFGVMLGIYWFGRRVVASETAARIGVALYAVYPNHIAYAGQATTETVYTGVAMAGLIALIAFRHRLGGLFGAGLVFGIAALIKPQTLAFPFGAVIALFWVYRDVRIRDALTAAIVVYLTMFAVVLPWSLRNQTVLGEFVLVSTNGGTALLLGANDQITGTHFEYQHTDVYRNLGIPWEQRVERQVELDRAQKDAAKQWIREHPLAYLGWMPKKVALLWQKDTDGFWAFERALPERTRAVMAAKVLNQAYYLLLLVTAGVCAIRAALALVTPGYERRALGLLFLMPVFVSLLGAVFTGQFRYHFPAMPFVILAAAAVASGALRPLGSANADLPASTRARS